MRKKLVPMREKSDKRIMKDYVKFQTERELEIIKKDVKKALNKMLRNEEFLDFDKGLIVLKKDSDELNVLISNFAFDIQKLHYKEIAQEELS